MKSKIKKYDWLSLIRIIDYQFYVSVLFRFQLSFQPFLIIIKWLYFELYCWLMRFFSCFSLVQSNFVAKYQSNKYFFWLESCAVILSVIRLSGHRMLGIFSCRPIFFLTEILVFKLPSVPEFCLIILLGRILSLPHMFMLSSITLIQSEISCLEVSEID